MIGWGIATTSAFIFRLHWACGGAEHWLTSGRGFSADLRDVSVRFERLRRRTGSALPPELTVGGVSSSSNQPLRLRALLQASLWRHLAFAHLQVQTSENKPNNC